MIVLNIMTIKVKGVVMNDILKKDYEYVDMLRAFDKVEPLLKKFSIDAKKIKLIKQNIKER